MTRRASEPRKKPIDPIELADLALDGERSLDETLGRLGASRSRRAAGHVRAIRRLERVLRLEKNGLSTAGRGPDFTEAILNEVDERRGWLDRPSRRLVWGGRTLAAAAVLMVIGAGLSVRRAAPEIVEPSRSQQALASVVKAGERAASDATAPIASVVETIEDGTPVMVRLTTTLSDDGAKLIRLTPSGSDDSLVMLRYVRSGPREASWSGSVVVESPLCPSTRRTVDAVAGVDRTPRWLRPMTTPSVWSAPVAEK